MKSKLYIYITAVCILTLYTFTPSLFAQTQQQKLADVIIQHDSLFWQSYNSCDITRFHSFFTKDVEFYHDKGGITLGLDSLVASAKKNLCGSSHFRLRREAVPGTVNVFPLQKSGNVYGAIISGQHVFYVLEQGKPERLDGLARFTHVWLLQNNAWKMSRILSYDHGPAPNSNVKKEIRMSGDLLKQYAGVYEAPKSGKLLVQPADNVLTLTINDRKFTLYPQTESIFFMKERDVSFEFVKTHNNKASKIIVREQGQIVEEAVLAK